MPKNKFQDVIFTIIMASLMVYGMVAYNIVLNTGSLQNWVFGAVFHEWAEALQEDNGTPPGYPA